MKRSFVVIGCAVLSVLICFPAFALELTKENIKKVPATYVTVEKDKMVFGPSSTAYSPDEFDKILQGYGLTLTPEGAKKAPTTYAKVDKDKIVFGKDTAAYSPETLNQILEAYGATLPADAVKGGKVPKTYATLEKDKIVFGKNSTAYSPHQLHPILAAYVGPARAEVPIAKPEVKPEPKPEVKPVPKPEAPKVITPDKCKGAPKGAKLDERGCWVLVGVNFDYNSATLRPESYSVLDEVAAVLKQEPDVKVRVAGHTCNIGGVQYNQTLSEKRADSVRRYLIQKGIKADRMSAIGYGMMDPAVPNISEENRAKNRRVELEPVKPGESMKKIFQPSNVQPVPKYEVQEKKKSSKPAKPSKPSKKSKKK